MNLGKVEKKTLGYTLLKMYAKFVHDFFYYKKVTYIGVENIPKDKPVLIAPNHQNALMDALAIIFAQDSQPVFLARSDIFKNPRTAKMLFAIKILPVYRMRDGKEKLKLNEIIYNKTIEVLKFNKRVVIFPEAQHFDTKHVHQLKKGIQRIAFMTEEENDFKAGVQIIPTGIYYSNYWNFRSKLIVKFGKPITLDDYFDDYKKDPARTIVKFSQVLRKKIIEQVIHIDDLAYHDEYDLLRDIYDKKLSENISLKLSSENKIKIDKEIVKKADTLKEKNANDFEKLMENIRVYSDKLKKFRIKDWVIERSGKGDCMLLRFLFILTGLPVFIYGFINNIIVYLLPSLITKKIKDRQFESSIKYGFSIFLFPVVYLIQFALVWIFVKIWYVAIIYLVTLPFFGLLAFMIHRLFVKTLAQFRFITIKNKEEAKSTIELRKEIINTMDKI